MKNKELITVSVVVNSPIDKVWDAFTKPEHITKWAFASNDWEAPYAENDLRVGGTALRLAGDTGEFQKVCGD